MELRARQGPAAVVAAVVAVAVVAVAVAIR